MRNTSQWSETLKKILKLHYKNEKEAVDTTLKVELGLYLLSTLQVSNPMSLWVILTGYPHKFPGAENWQKKEKKMIAIARYLLPDFYRSHLWQKELEIYQNLPADACGYNIDINNKTFTQRIDITIANQRFETYKEALKTPVKLSERNKINWATAGKYIYIVNNRQEILEIPQLINDIEISPLATHNLQNKLNKQPLQVSWQELQNTAEWMDEQLIKKEIKPTWLERFKKLKLKLFNETGQLLEADTLIIDKIFHLGGILSAGKSNLMKILTVWAWQRGKHTTLIVADLLQIFELVKIFHQLGIEEVVPIVGNSNMQSHLRRLHNAVYDEQPQDSFEQNHPVFQWLSSNCLLTPLMQGEIANSFPLDQPPCLSLTTLEKKDENNNNNHKQGCPFYSVCPSHSRERDLTKARIWIATPSSLIYSRVSPAINRENILYFELMARVSELVIVDEVDTHQANLDRAFSISQTLSDTGRNGWLKQLQNHVESLLKQTNTELLNDKKISQWWRKCQEINRCVDEMYHLVQEKALEKWAERKNYFTNWLLLREVAGLMTIPNYDSDNWEITDNFSNLMISFEKYLDDINNNQHELFGLARSNDNRQKVKEWVKNNNTVNFNDGQIEDLTVKLMFTLLVCDLQYNLYSLMFDWQELQSTLKLNTIPNFNRWFDTPPQDFSSIIPPMPMGNQFAFQYQKSYDEKRGSLQFFRCVGIGRWLFLHFADLYKADQFTPPNILFLSGTSWAGNSPAYHFGLPVQGLLHPENQAGNVSQIKSEFLYFPDGQGKPLSISGTGDKKRQNLERIVSALINEDYLQDTLNRLNGKKILLLVNSYEQVDWVRQIMENLDWKDKIIALCRDDSLSMEDMDDQVLQLQSKNLQRGQVAKFANMSEDILIAPLKAMERGHNIVGEDGIAKIGAAYFLVLPHPDPNDLSYAIHSINRWAVDHYLQATGEDIEKLGDKFREDAYKQWKHLLYLPIKLNRLDTKDHTAVIWDILVCLWQVIGRLIRGGNHAEIYWCDAKFGINSANNIDNTKETNKTSILIAMVELLRPYFSDDENLPQFEKTLVRALYEPFYRAIAHTKNLKDLPKELYL